VKLYEVGPVILPSSITKLSKSGEVDTSAKKLFNPVMGLHDMVNPVVVIAELERAAGVAGTVSNPTVLELADDPPAFKALTLIQY
jgi:hypothetical protein